MQITEEKLAEIENDLIRFFRHVALPRYIKHVRVEQDHYNQFTDINYIDDFLIWLNEGADLVEEITEKNGTRD